MSTTTTKPKKDDTLMIDIHVEAMIPTVNNPRYFNGESEKYKELLDSVQSVGVTTPIVVRDHPTEKGKYEILAGERRYRAAKEAGLVGIPCLFHVSITNAEAFEITYLENYGREDLTPFEEGRAVMMLLEVFDDDVEAVAAKMGRTPLWIRSRAKLCNLSSKFSKALTDSKSPIAWMTILQLETIARYPHPIQNDIIEKSTGWEFRDGAMKNLDKYLESQFMHKLHAAPWDTAAAGIAKKKSCVECPKRTGRQMGLWPVDAESDPSGKITDKADRCLDSYCWKEKVLVALNGRLAELRKDHAKLVVIVNGSSYNYAEKRDTAEALGTEILGNYEYTFAKKDDKNAVAALVAIGPGAGSLRWITGWGGDMATQGREKGTPTPLKERRKRLGDRHSKYVLDHVAEIMHAQLDPPADEHLYALAAFYGVTPSVDHQRHRGFEAYLEWNDPVRVNTEAVKLALWAGLKGNLEGPLKHYSNCDTGPMMTHALGICGILEYGITIFDNLKKAAREEMPEPKTWAHLKEDGTPKKSKKKADKKSKKTAETTTEKTTREKTARKGKKK